jgi:ABC-type transporter Mla subunit MlaD
MKIKRFNESEQVDISSERVGEIIKELNGILSSLEDNSKSTDSYLNELNNYKSQSKKGNDQIDDSISALQIVRKNLKDSVDKLETVINNLMNYNDEGRKLLYTEGK